MRGGERFHPASFPPLPSGASAAVTTMSQQSAPADGPAGPSTSSEIDVVAAPPGAGAGLLGKRPRVEPKTGETVTTGELAAVIGPYVQSAGMETPTEVQHNRRSWKVAEEPWRLWSSKSKVGAFFDTFTSGAADDAGDYLVRCRICALHGSTCLYFLKGGKTSNAGKHLSIGATVKSFSDEQRRHHALVASRVFGTVAPELSTRTGSADTSGAMMPFLRPSKRRAFSAAQARPHHLRFVLMLVSTLSPHALAADAQMGTFLSELEGPYKPPARSTVTELLLDLYVYVREEIKATIVKLRGQFHGLPFLHVVTDMWSERHGSGSYGSVVVSFICPDAVEARELQLGVSPFIGVHTHLRISEWVMRRLAYFGIQSSDVSSATTDSGSNVRKAMLDSDFHWVPCAAHAVHNAVKTAIGATGAAPPTGEVTQQPPRKQSSNPAAHHLMGRVRKLINHFHKSSKSVAILDGLPFPGDESPRHLLPYCHTRWGSTFVSLGRLFTLQPRLEQFETLPALSAKIRHLLPLPTEYEAIRHLIGVLQPAFEVTQGVQRSSQTLAEAFEYVCRLRRTMAGAAFSVPCEFDRPLAVGKEAILRFLSEDERGTDVLELDSRLYKFKDVSMDLARGRTRLCEEARVLVRVLRTEIDARFFNPQDNTKNWLANEAVLSAVILTPGGAAMLGKISQWMNGGDPAARARKVVWDLFSSLSEPADGDQRRRAALLHERNECRTTLVGWDDDSSADVDTHTRPAVAAKELEAFLSATPTQGAGGALAFWRARKLEFPNLFLVACSVLGASGSSASSERCFSAAGSILRKERSALLPRHLEMHSLVRSHISLLPKDLSRLRALSRAERAAAREAMDETAKASSVDSSDESGVSGDEEGVEGEWSESDL